MGKPTPALQGRKFGMLEVIERAGSRRGRALWLCRCGCGRETRVTTDKLTGANTRSCGCQVGGVTHGQTRKARSPTYRSWQAMIARCTQPSNPAYEYYKARGITVCKRWRKFENFLADLGERPSLAYTLDRYPDNDGSYRPGNCRWATRQQQANNRRTNAMFVYRGTAVTLAELARLTGLPKDLLAHRLLRARWSVEEAVTTPKRQGWRRDLQR
jgi:hypothetical protein